MVFAEGKMTTCPEWSGVRDHRVVLEGVGIVVDHAYVIALLSFVVVLMLDLAASRPVRRTVWPGES
jgi:hypothetical protein